MITLAPAEAYRRPAADYDALPNPLVALEERVVAPLLPDLAGKIVVDAAAGTGRWAERSRALGARTIAIDFCAEMLAHAPRPSVLADLLRLPLADGCADLTICAFAIGYSPHAISELVRITRKGGWVLVSDVHPDALQRGWTRSFRRGPEVIGVAHQPYSLDDLEIAGIKRVRLIEPRLGEPEKRVFAAAGKLAAFDDAARHPAIFVALWTRV